MSELALRRIAECKRTRATRLDLINCDIQGPLPMELAQLTWLEELNLGGNPFLPQPLATPQDTLAKPQPVHNLQALATLKNLRKVDLRNTQVVDLWPLQGLARLEWLSLRQTQVEDLSPLQGLTQLERLSLDNTLVADLLPLKGLTHLQVLLLSNTRVASLRPVQELPNLKTLWLDNSRVEDLRPLEGLTRLQSLSLAGTRVADLWPLQGLVQLQELSLHSTWVADLLPLKGLSELKWLSLSGTWVADLRPIQGLAQLRTLRLDDTRIEDLVPLQGLLLLHTLSLDDTKVADLSPLKGQIRNGIKLHVDNCPLTNPPIEVARQGNEAILKYWERASKASNGFLTFCNQFFQSEPLQDEFLDWNIEHFKSLHFIALLTEDFPERKALLQTFAKIGMRKPQTGFLNLLENRPSDGLDTIPVPVAIMSDGTEMKIHGFKREVLGSFKECLASLGESEDYVEPDFVEWEAIIEGEDNLIDSTRLSNLQQQLAAMLGSFYASLTDGMPPGIRFGPPQRGSHFFQVIVEQLPEWGAWMVKNGPWIATLDIGIKWMFGILKFGRQLVIKGAKAVKGLRNRKPPQLPAQSPSSLADQALLQQVLNFLERAVLVVQHSKGDFVLRQAGQEVLRVKKSDLAAINAVIEVLSVRMESLIGALIRYKGPHGSPPDPAFADFISEGRIIKGQIADAVYTMETLPVMKPLRADMDRILVRDPELDIFLESYVLVKEIEVLE